MGHSKDVAKVTQGNGTQSHNFLPSKIGCGIMSQQPLSKPGQQQTAAPTAALLMHGKTNSAAHLYQTTKEACTAEKVVLSNAGPSAPKISN